MQWHEITKYLPEGYNDRVYTLDEWTSISDIGKVYNGKVFTIQDYEATERKYINAVSKVLLESKCYYLTIDYIEIDKVSLIDDLMKSPYNCELQQFQHLFLDLRKGKRIYIKSIAPIIQLCLREYCYMVLCNRTKQIMIDFGYDYYLNIGSQINTKKLSSIVRSCGLYLDARG